MNDMIEYDDLNIGLADQTDEYVVLYESDDKKERIVLFRNMIRQIEYVLLSPSLLCSDDSKFITRNYLELNEYHLLLNYQRKIQLYQFQENRLELFHAFFRMTTTTFFRTISAHHC